MIFDRKIYFFYFEFYEHYGGAGLSIKYKIDNETEYKCEVIEINTSMNMLQINYFVFNKLAPTYSSNSTSSKTSICSALPELKPIAVAA